MRINLLEEENKKVAFDFLRVGLLLIFLITIMMIGIIHYSLISEKNNLQTEISNLDKQLKIYLPEQRKFKDFEKTINRLKNTPTVPGYNLDGPIEALGYITPLRAVINNFSINQDRLNIRGETSVGEELAVFREALIDSPYFRNVKVETMEKQKMLTFIIKAEIVEEVAE